MKNLDVRDLLGLVDEVCRRRAVTREEIGSRTRTKAVAWARHELWWRLRHDPEACFSYAEIGRLFCRDHVTILHGVRAHQRRLAEEARPPIHGPAQASIDGPPRA
jgi:chromosomal replication initiation ATPase DnaA